MTRKLSLATLAALAACTAGPEYTRPELDTGRGWIEPPTAAGPEADLSRWWERFDDPTLARLVDQALDDNLDVRQAATRVAEARALRDAATGGRYPVVDVGASVTRRRQSENGPLPIDRIPGLERDQTIYEPGFDAFWELDVFGRTRRTVEAADARLDQAVELDRAARLSVAAEMARAYFELRGAQHGLDALDAALDSARESMDLVARRLDAGDVSEAELAQAEAELARLEADRPMLAARVRVAVQAIGVLVGGLPETEVALLATGPAFAALAALPVGERADLLRRRPDVRAAERALAAATADIGVRTADLFPRISIAANGGFQSLSTGDLLESASEFGAIAPLITWRGFAAGRVRAEIRATEARAEAAALAYEQAVQQALADAERALTRYEAGRVALDSRARALDAATRSYALADARYRGGDISLLELLDAERALHNAESSYAATHTQAATDLVALFKALGGGWGNPGEAG
jgi:NodT family efflux transporter outer membrane factor (OMF) lipoprotein